uniref:FlgD/Vpr Ig-like domain-containing protein n=1 Tax=Eiseniibacteriota bacterium TaxID=2212470 RepID=A0A832MLV1_UNCEI
MTSLRSWLLAACLALAAMPAHAFTPQTIVIDGVNDFDPSNLLDDDRNDTQTFCSPPALPLDLGRVYITNDANFLYIGIEFSRTCFCDMNLGLSIDTGSAAGGSSDPFGRAIGWANLANKPDYIVYDVTPTNCNTFNYEVLYKWNTGTLAWDNISTQVNPGWGSGSNGLGIGDGNDFKEIKLPLSVLGLSTGSPVNLEVWVTQEGSTKGPLDALCSDNVQMSRVGTTTFDTAAVVQMTCQFPFTVLNAVDATPPIVSSAVAADFQVLLDRTFAPVTNKIDVIFSEPVNEAAAENPANYAFSGPGGPNSVSSAVRDNAATNVVRLTLANGIGAAGSFYDITVTGVTDLAGNPIVNNGTTNVGSFFIQNVTFNNDVSLQLCSGVFAPEDTFAVEGNLAPLSFALCDNALMYDDEGDSVYTVTVPFALPKDRITGLAEANLEWKLTRQCSQYESFPGNRTYTLSSTNGASVALDVAWNNDNPANFIERAVDVVFQVDASSFSPGPGDVMTLLGNIGPLSFTQPGVPMLDNGVAPDAAAGDGIYTVRVTFPACSFRFIEWKVDWNGVIECAGQGNRAFTLDDVAYSTTTPQVLPARGIDRCTVTDKAIDVVFSVDMRFISPAPAPGDSVAVMGNASPLAFTLPPSAAQLMADDGVAPDAQAGDRIFTRTVTFPDSTPFNVGFKYWFDAWPTNGGFECEGFGDRTITLDDQTHSQANPLVLLLSTWNYCTQPVAAPPGPAAPAAAAGAAFASLRPAFPTPFATKTTIAFDLKRSGRVSARVYDITGRRLATLLDRDLVAGPHSVVWDGRDQSGARVRSGVYLLELSMGSERVGGRLVVTR